MSEPTCSVPSDLEQIRPIIAEIIADSVAPFLGDVTYSTEQARQGIEDRVADKLRDRFPDSRAETSACVLVNNSQPKPVYHIGATAYGIEMSAKVE